MRNSALTVFAYALSATITDAGLVTDEFFTPQAGQGVIRTLTPLSSDERYGTGASSYGALQNARNSILLANEALATYDSTSPLTLRGELLALGGYAEVYLAELYCSGVPLSSITFNGDFTYRAGSTSDAVLLDALAKYDSSIVLSKDSMRLVNLARLGKGRAWLALGAYDSAAVSVHDVPNGFVYEIALQNQRGSRNTVSDREGLNGIPWLTDRDARTRTAPIDLGAIEQYRTPAKYALTDGYDRFVVASSVEARLIEAEAALQRQDITTWYATMQTLRTTGAYTSIDTVVDHVTDSVDMNGTTYSDTTFRVDTQWVAGTGGVSGIRPLPTTEPGAGLPGVSATAARVNLLFHERAYWLFATGHRQGDLRRLIRQYGRPQSQVYPVGPYPGSGIGVYGSVVPLDIPAASEQPNPLFKGCLNHDA